MFILQSVSEKAEIGKVEVKVGWREDVKGAIIAVTIVDCCAWREVISDEEMQVSNLCNLSL